MRKVFPYSGEMRKNVPYTRIEGHNSATRVHLGFEVRLSGQLVCRTNDQAVAVRDHLPLHIFLTRAEEGCCFFDVTTTRNPLIWQVEERFEHAAAFEVHQKRVADSAWGRATQGIERRYTVTGL